MSDNPKYFLDTNIVVYAYDWHEPQKMDIARQILRQGMSEENAVLSPQVLGEFFVVVTKKIKAPFSPEAALEVIETLGLLSAVEMDHQLVVKATNIHIRYNISYWDGLIVAAAERAGCSTLLTEDLKQGEIYNGVKVDNPFN